MLKAVFSDTLTEAGLDEAGRGCLAGPVVAAFVILPRDYFHPILNDSKQLTKKQREILRKEIEREAIDFAIGEVCNNEIDRINILNASFLAMHKALDKFKCTPELLLVDGNRFKQYKTIPHECIVEGDAKYFSIAAASVLAKTYRDDLMRRLSAQYPLYDWENNMGYATQKHRNAIVIHGITPYHRRSFTCAKDQLLLFK
jgi:ribonuclease HII